MEGESEVRGRLTVRLSALNERVGRIETDFSQPLDQDFSEQAAQREAEEPLVAIEAAALSEMDQIRAALRRLDAGEYGTCVTCGDAISPDRLAVLPESAECVSCATVTSRLN